VNPGAFTVSVIVAVAVIGPEVPVTVSVALPTAAELLAMIVNSPLEVMGLGVKNAVTPLGKPLTDKVTFPVNPFDPEISTKVELVVP
jgi:hypothetical protein